MTKDVIGNHKALEERRHNEAARVEAHRKHNHQLTRQARIARRERHKQNTMVKHGELRP